MFNRVKDLISKGQQLADKADGKLDQAQLVLDLAKALVEDFQDGFAVKFHLDEDAAKKFMQVLTGQSGEIPVNVIIDPSWDVFPSRIALFKGGPYDGKRYSTPTQQTELVLEGNHRYKWNGKVFMYITPKQ